MQKPKKERWEYFWDYYKWHVIIFLLVIAISVQGIINLINHKDAIFTGYVLNCSTADSDEDFLQGFYDFAGIDSSKEEAAFYTDMYIREGQSQTNAEVFNRIMAGVAIGDGDVIIGKPEPFRPCAYHTSRILVDLREFLDQETLEKLSDRLYYIDGAVLQQLSKPVGEEIGQVFYPDPRKPEIMDDPIPVGIDVSDRVALRESYYYESDAVVYLGFMGNSTRKDLALQFLNYLFP